MSALFDIEGVLYQDLKDYREFLVPGINLERERNGLAPLTEEEEINDFLDNYLKRNDAARANR